MDLDDLLKSIREEGEPKKGGAIVPAKFFGEDRYDKIYQELLSEGKIEGDNLSPEERKEGVKAYRKSKIDFEKFVDRVLKVKQEVAPAKAGLTSGTFMPKALPSAKEIAVESEDVVAENIQEDDLDGINEKLDDLLDHIRTMNEIEEKQTEKQRKKDERERREKKENKREKVKNFLLKPIEKALKPVNDLFSRIIGGLFKILAAKALIKLIDWFTDPANEEKVNAIGRFVKDFWPAILAGFLIIGTGLGGLATTLLGTGAKLIGSLFKLAGRLGKITLKLGAKAFRFAAKNPLLAAGALAAGGAFIASQQNEEKREGVEPGEGAPGPAQLQREQTLQRGLGGMFSGGGLAPKGTDVVPAMLTPGEFVMSKGAVDTFGTDFMRSINAAGGGTNRPTKMDGTTYAAGGGSIEVKGTGNTVEGTLKMKDASGKQVGKTYSAISGTYAGMNISQNQRSTTRGAPLPDGNYKLVGFEKHGPYPGLPGIGNWSTYVANSSGSIGSRSGIMLHNDIGSNGTLGCVGVELGGKAGTKAEQEFLQTYQSINPTTIKVALGKGGGDASEVSSIDRTVSPDNSSRAAALQPAQSATPRVSPGAITPPSAQPGSQGMTPVPIPYGQQGQGGAQSQGSDVPDLGSIDPHNMTLLVMKSMYNLSGA